ncbi:MAG: DUF3536 domain-containing protein [Gemmatimonadaceae bacterium]
MKRSIVLHAHFYQPPRENPFFEDIEVEASAAPFHDWNQRIERECYRAVVGARIPGTDGRIARVINTLEWISFNVGPTLFEWMERYAPDTYQQILAADQASVARLGHGNAIAQPYHHAILPLASRRDKTSEVRWGKADFRRRFGREPDGMWLPETAVDEETLDVLAEEGIRFTILAPHQVTAPPPNGLPGRYVTTGGREIALCLYNGDISHGIAFGGLVRDAGQWLEALWSVRPTRRKASGTGASAGVTAEHPATAPLLVSAATDGETYGHHHRFAEMALARVLEGSRARGGIVENYASFLARYPAMHDVTLVSPTSWSCSHGVERWRSNCGCRMDQQLAPSQAWRTPLRTALNALSEELHDVFEDEGRRLIRDVWAARDAYGPVIGSGDLMERARFLGEWCLPDVAGEARSRALELLEMERDAMRMFTSCAWFFDDIAGIEARQVLRYAMRAIELSGARERLEPTFLSTLGDARSNDRSAGSGADVYRTLRHPATPDARSAAAARALRDLRLDVERHLPPGFDASVDDAAVHTITRATARARAFRVALSRQTSNDLSYEITPLDRTELSPPIVPLAEFPERSRLAVRAALRQALLPRCLSLDELEQLASGEVSLQGVSAVALTRAIQRLAHDRSPDALDVGHAALDLFEQLETSIPFDAQTAFWRVWEAMGPDERPVLRRLGERLGFVLT